MAEKEKTTLKITYSNTITQQMTKQRPFQCKLFSETPELISSRAGLEPWSSKFLAVHYLC